MGKVSIGLRGWRFDEDEVFDAEGELRELGKMEPDTRQRIVRLSAFIGEPCDACFLEHGQADVDQCNVGAVIYGEPLGEVLLCEDHEADFLYWFREDGGSEFKGETELRDRFHEWFMKGGRAPEGYAGLEHVDEEPDRIPDAPERAGEIPGLEEELEDLDDDDIEALDLDLSEFDV
ncbi:hypothetical protein VB773_14555 [Haloarculaceae archaeon H-GB2-1]|nr:hypothetical protein [Haloarculaceae archaeon H-GB1-1]MEA5387176.1 hypothetical protein [Haloarculaceae archaeon H-GB11]MEA5408669.1 hypothetical protein [Haloarculaceae archaeon H-GB2-1]